LRAGESAARYASGKLCCGEKKVPIQKGKNVHHVIPHFLDPTSLQDGEEQLQMRVTRPLEQPVKVQVLNGTEVVVSRTLPYARPGEMVTIGLKEKHREQVQTAQQLSVQVIEKE
jgi:hypothetical protein